MQQLEFFFNQLYTEILQFLYYVASQKKKKFHNLINNPKLGLKYSDQDTLQI